ncbi:MAG: hypothetical protein U5K29_05990 [Acidimicrobiales bacterium]|nr:hypothetical protein [Acidimicrobiales bacterium]
MAPATTTAIVGVVAYSVVVARIEPFTRPSEVAIGLGILAIAAIAVRAGWHRRGPTGARLRAPRSSLEPGSRRSGSVLIAAIGLFQLAQFQSNPREPYPTLSSLASIAFGTWPVRAAAIAGWIGLGIYLVGAGPRKHHR